jgi:tetratricopeptide (TPR) repeat protein
MTSAQKYFQRGYAKYSHRKYEEAIEDYSVAIRINPNNADYFNNRGVSKHDLGRYEEAIEDYSAAIRIDPNHIFARANIGLSKCSKGDWEGGLLDLKEAVQRKPSDYSYSCLCFALLRQGNIESAKTNFLQAFKNNPNSDRLQVIELVINLFTSQNPSINDAINVFHKHKQANEGELFLVVLVLSEKNYRLFQPLIAAMLEHLSIVFPRSVAVKDVVIRSKEIGISQIQNPSPSAKQVSFLIEFKEKKVRMPKTPISSLDDLLQKIRDRLKIGDGNVRIEIFDDTFGEYVTLDDDDFQLLEKTKHKLRVATVQKKEEGEREYSKFVEEEPRQESGMNIKSDIPSNEVEKIRKLAEGHFGVVYEGKWNRAVAIKELKEMDEKFLEEVHLMR